MKTDTTGDARRERFLGEGDFDCGSNQLSASPKLTSLVTFLFSDKKVTAAASRRGRFVQGAVLFVTSQSRSVRYCRWD